MAASHLEVSNLTAIIDRNRIQNDDFVDSQMRIGDVASKFLSFGWDVINIDGHDMKEIINSLLDAKNRMKPTAIVAATVKGKGVSFMENNPSFHGAAPNENQYAEAMEELS